MSDKFFLVKIVRQQSYSNVMMKLGLTKLVQLGRLEFHLQTEDRSVQYVEKQLKKLVQVKSFIIRVCSVRSTCEVCVRCV